MLCRAINTLTQRPHLLSTTYAKQCDHSSEQDNFCSHNVFFSQIRTSLCKISLQTQLSTIDTPTWQKQAFIILSFFFFSNKFKNSKVVHDLVFKNKLMPHLLILGRVGVPHKWIFQIIHTCPFKHQNLNCFTWRCLKKTTQKNSTGF